MKNKTKKHMNNSFVKGLYKKQLIVRGDLQGLGKYFFRSAMEKLLKKDFYKASCFMKEGLNYLTCDCNQDNWIEKSGLVTVEDWRKMFSEPLEKASDAYLFIFSYLTLFSPDSYSQENSTRSMVAIDKYLNRNNCNYGYYIKARLLVSNNNESEAIKILKDNFKNLSSTMVVYRLGRYDESIEGFTNLLKAFIWNPSCSCTIREIYERYHKKVDCNSQRIRCKKNKIDGRLCLAFAKPNNFKGFMKLYTPIRDNMPNLNFQHLKSHEDKYFSDFFKFIDALHKSNDRVVKMINRSLKKEPPSSVLRSRSNADDNEEMVMRALRNGQGDKFGY